MISIIMRLMIIIKRIMAINMIIKIMGILYDNDNDFNTVMIMKNMKTMLMMNIEHTYS